MSNNVLPPYPGGANPVSSLSTSTYGPNIGLSLDNHPSVGGTVYPFPYIKGGSGCSAKMGGSGCGAKCGGRSKSRSKPKKGGKWSLKYKRSINCRQPKGFSQRQHCKYGRGKTARRS